VKDTCIINFAKGHWYPRGQARLIQSLKDTGFDGDLYCWNDEKQIGAPPHEMMPYAFKIAAFNRVADMGYRRILWCDAAVFAIKSIQPVFDHIKQHGHVLFHSGFNCAQWTSDACLNVAHITRDEAEKMPMYMACCMGLDLDNPRSVEFLRRLTQQALDGVSLPGAWRNDQNQVSQDPRCQGHRHDQSIGSLVAAQLGMEVIIAHHTYFAYYGPGVYQYGAPNNDMSGIQDSVVLLTQGM
jgi:hypothetical protein